MPVDVNLPQAWSSSFSQSFSSRLPFLRRARREVDAARARRTEENVVSAFSSSPHDGQDHFEGLSAAPVAVGGKPRCGVADLLHEAS